MSAHTAIAWQNARNILCVRVDNLGDVLMTTPAIRALKTASPHRRITLLTSQSGAEVARFIPDIDTTIQYDAPWVKHGTPPNAARDLAMRETLADGAFDAAVIFTVYSQNPLPAAMLCHLAGIPLRLAHCRENPYQLLTDWVAESDPGDRVRHEVQRQLDLVAAVGAHIRNSRMRFEVPPPAHSSVAKLLSKVGIKPASTVIVMHPGASAESRRYPPDQYSIVARSLIDTLDCDVVVTGSAAERKLADVVCSRAAATGRVRNMAGVLGLGELAALIARANVLVSNNTGPVHIASSVGTPVVDLYALTNPQHTPWQVPNRVLYHDVPCRYCYKSVCPRGHNDCLRRVRPDEIVEATCELLEDCGASTAVATMPPMHTRVPRTSLHAVRSPAAS
jgi:lipopolysaccharide heptosyltransferase II